jgi:hypothetical protein
MVCALFVALVCFALFAQGGSAQPPADSAPLTLDSVAWLSGEWQGRQGDRPAFEEHWSKPAAGAMMGMFRMYSGEQVMVYEFLLLEQSAEGVSLRLRHYRPQMTDVEAEPIHMKLVASNDSQIVFENATDALPKRITYKRAGEQMTAVVETMRNEQPTTFSLEFQLVRSTTAGEQSKDGAQ